MSVALIFVFLCSEEPSITFTNLIELVTNIPWKNAKGFIVEALGWLTSGNLAG